jgi:RHS repeat-associated protein
VTNGAGNVVGIQNFDSFGGGGSSNGGALQFTAHERDAAALGGGDLAMPDYMHARYYEMSLGRFLSVDPIGGKPRRPASFNRYVYAWNNPLRLVDPDGREPLDPNVRTFLEAYFGGRDLSRVQVYGGIFARAIARIANADAITFGNRIFFSGTWWRQYKSKTVSGVALAGHEVHHTIQYSEAGGIVRFLLPYLGEYFANRRAGMSREDAYNAIISETQAYWTQEEIENFLTLNHDVLQAIQVGTALTTNQIERIQLEIGWMPRNGTRHYINDPDDPFRGTGFCDASNTCH